MKPLQTGILCLGSHTRIWNGETCCVLETWDENNTIETHWKTRKHMDKHLFVSIVGSRSLQKESYISASTTVARADQTYDQSSFKSKVSRPPEPPILCHWNHQNHHSSDLPTTQKFNTLRRWLEGDVLPVDSKTIWHSSSVCMISLVHVDVFQYYLLLWKAWHIMCFLDQNCPQTQVVQVWRT